MSEISRKVLFVDDDENILRAFHRQFRNKLDMATANGGEAGLKVLEEQGPFAAVVSDYQMPGMNGVQFLQKVHEQSPDSVVVMLTFIADLNVVVSALHEGKIYRFLNKPCPASILEQTLQDCMEQYRLVVSERMLRTELDRANAELCTINADLEKRVAERTLTIWQLFQFVSDLNGMDSLKDVAELVVKTAAETLKSRRVSLMMPDVSGEYLTIAAATGIDLELKDRIRVPVGSPISGFVFSEGQTLVVNEANDLPRGEGQRYESDIFASLPLMCASLATPTRPVGVLNVTEHLGNTPYESEALAELKMLAEAATIALSNQIRREERNDARDAIIMALASLAEHRDPETGAHLERVQQYCKILSQSLRQTPKYEKVVDKDFVEHIERSSPLHDIGKVGIPDNILQKPGRLTPEEFEIMKRHAVIGGDTIRGIVAKGRPQPFLQMGMEIAYHHHEKFDGSGYPHGLAGERIPLAARILALADVYDALTSKRCYKDAMPHEKAAGIICGDSGKHFDPDVVAAFRSCEEEFKRLARDLAEEVEIHATTTDMAVVPSGQ